MRDTSKQVVKFGFLSKTNLKSAVRDTSCSRGWLRWVVQCIFSMITVASFIMILIMAVQRSPSRDSDSTNDPGSRCVVSNCRVVCSQAPYFENYEDDIINAVLEAEGICGNVCLTLNNPAFVNASLPPNWLSGTRTNIFELSIVGGNLKYISQNTFMSEFTTNVKTLVFEDVTISAWEPDMLVGLSSLEQLYIKDCAIFNIQRSALRTVDETLQKLSIRTSGSWNPNNLTGSSDLVELTQVDFSFNVFSDVLGRNSFSRLRFCKILYLNSCKITAIGAGAFDFLVNIKMIYLNNNLLTTIPSGLFDRMMAVVNPKPRIDLQDNLWHCDCSSHDLRLLSVQGVLLVDPVCYYPERLRGISFINFETQCNDSIDEVIVVDTETMQNSDKNETNFIYMNGACHNNNVTFRETPRLISLVRDHQCLSNDIKNFDFSLITIRRNYNPTHSNWFKPTVFIKGANYSMVEIGSSALEGYGLLWYQSTCPNEVYCINILPDFLRMYNVDTKAWYTFCPMLLTSRTIESDNCVAYNISSFENGNTKYKQLFWYVSIAALCLIFGAIFVYGIIRRNPSLLKGSKRILFVKHKTVDALVLPPKVPLRNNVLIDQPMLEFNKKKIFLTPSSQNNLTPRLLVRTNSTRSSKSNTPSYISALQPTEDQLAEWRLKHHFDNNTTITSLTSDLSTISWIYDKDSLYYSINQYNEKTYESLK